MKLFHVHHDRLTAGLTMGLAVSLFLSPGCIFGGGGGDDLSFDPSTPDPMVSDFSEIEALQRRLDQTRTEFQGEIADDTRAGGNRLFWAEYRAWAPTLVSYDQTTGQTVRYQFSIGEGDDVHYRVSETAIATVDFSSDNIYYSVYAADRPNTLLYEVSFEKPGAGIKFHAFALRGQELFVIDQSGSGHLLVRCASGSCADVTTLEAAGAGVAEFWDFGIDGDMMVFVESGRIWRMSLSALDAEWLDHEQQVGLHISFEPSGEVLFPMGSDYMLSVPGQGLSSLSELVSSADFIVGSDRIAPEDTGAIGSPQLPYEGGAVLVGNHIVYIGRSGVMAYDRQNRVVLPLLLEPRASDVRITYRYPTVLDSKTIYVTGLTSTSGSVGADGPLYEIDLETQLGYSSF